MALLAVVVAVPPTGATPGQDLPPTAVIPPLPDELDPLTAAISPVVWQACNGVGLAVGLITLAGTLAGVPPDVVVPLNDAIGTLSGPVLRTFFEICQQIPLPEDPPDCETDQLIPLLPSLGRPFPPAALLANELRALDTALQGAGLPLDGALGDAADDLLACAAGQNPEPDPPAEGEPEPDAGSNLAPAVGTGGPSGGGARPSSTPPGGGIAPVPGASKGGPPSGDAFPVAQPINASTGGSGTGLAMALLGLALLAALGWLHAGNPRPARVPDPETAAP
jgi:hypothetical protein